jgi:ketosteroid isomerase-like protein
MARVLKNTFAFFLNSKRMSLKKINLILTFFMPFFFLPMSCRPKTNLAKNISPDEIIKADKAFSEMSRKTGMKKAFLEYIDNEGILLRANHPPIVGADAIDFLSQVNDSAYTLTWMPDGGELASSANLGYTYGIYKLEMKDTVLKGTYVSIWKKQPDGKWKFVLDSGNQGIGQ